MVRIFHDGAADSIDLGDLRDFVAHERQAIDRFLVGGHDLHRVPDRAEMPRLQIGRGALEVHRDQRAQHFSACGLKSLFEFLVYLLILSRRTETVDAGNRSHDDHVLSGQERLRGRVAQTVDLFVDLGFLLDIGVRNRHVCLRLIVVVVRDEVMNGVVREKVSVLLRQLRRQSFVVRDHQGRLLNGIDDIGHGEGLAGSGHAQKRLVGGARLQAFKQFLYSLRLIASGRFVCSEFKFHNI